MLQAGSREEVRSQLPGDRDWEWSGGDLFSIEQSQSKANVGWEADKRLPQPHRGLLLYCPQEGWGECRWCWRGKGEGGARRKRGGRRVRWSEIFSPFQLSAFGFSPTAFIIPRLQWIQFNSLTNCEVLEGRHLSYLPSCLSIAPRVSRCAPSQLFSVNAH